MHVLARDYRFGSSMSEEVLRSYLSRSMTTMYLVEFDNYGRSRRPGEASQGRFWIWGWDEITWFSQQPEDARND